MKSCCDEYCSNFGCNQGRSCPARQACELPEIPANSYLRYAGCLAQALICAAVIALPMAIYFLRMTP